MTFRQAKSCSGAAWGQLVGSRAFWVRSSCPGRLSAARVPRLTSPPAGQRHCPVPADRARYPSPPPQPQPATSLPFCPAPLTDARFLPLTVLVSAGALSDFLVFPLPLFTVLPFPFLFCLLAKLRIPYYVPRIVLGSGELEVKTRIPAGRTLTGSFFPFSNLHRPLFSFHPTFPLYYHLLFPLPALFLQESFFWRVPG